MVEKANDSRLRVIEKYPQVAGVHHDMSKSLFLVLVCHKPRSSTHCIIPVC